MRVGRRDPTTVKENGWRQGCVLRPTLVRRLIKDGAIHTRIQPDNRQSTDFFRGLLVYLTNCFGRLRHVKALNADTDLWIVVSHDCDVTNSDFAAEPWVELLRLKLSPEKKGDLHWGKNPRRYQLADSTTGSLLEVEIHDLVRVSRWYLADDVPDDARRLDELNVRRLVRWIAQRYVRSAFADAFNDRTRPAVKRLAKHFKRNGHLLTGIYLTVSDEELDRGKDYEIDVCATMHVEHHADPEHADRQRRFWTRSQPI